MLAAYKLFHGKKKLSFLVKNSLMVKTDTWLVLFLQETGDLYALHLLECGLVTTIKQHWAEGKTKLWCSCCSKLHQSPGEF